MDKNLKVPENIDKLIINQASEPSFLDSVFKVNSKNSGINKKTSKVYKKVYYKGSKRKG